MDFKRLRLIAGVSMCVLVAYSGTSLAMDRTARWVEERHDGYLWWREEWMQLFGANNFVGRGGDRILLAGSSEVREGFLFDEFEAGLPGFDVYNNAFSNQTLQTLLIVLQYIETTYGPAAIPQKIVLGITPLFLLDEPPLDTSYWPRVIDSYSPSVRLVVGSKPPRLIRKGWFASLEARYRYLTHQSRRYQGALRGVMRAGLVSVIPGLADRYRVRPGLVPSNYHHLPPRDKKERLQALRRNVPSPPDPVAVAATVRAEWTVLREFVAKHDIGLYVVNMPQSTLMLEDYYAGTYDDYEQLVRGLTGDIPFLDLARDLRDDEFHDIVHANLAGARRLSRRVAQFVRETDAARRQRPSARLDRSIDAPGRS